MYSHCNYIHFCNNGDAVFFFFFFFYVVVVVVVVLCRTSLRLLSDAEKRGKPPVKASPGGRGGEAASLCFRLCVYVCVCVCL